MSMIHELSTFHNPIKYRFIVAQGSYLNAQNQRVYFTPEIKGVSTSQHMSHSVIRLACYLAVVCGVSLRHIALLFSVLFLIPITKSSIKRWIDDIGVHLPTPEEMLRQLLALTPATECHIDGYYPLGTDHCVMVVKDEHDRILITHEAASENGEDARQFLQRLKTSASMSPRPSRITPKASPKRSKRSILMPDFRPTISIRSRISGGTSKNRCSPTAGRSRRVGKKKRMSNFWPWPSSYGSCVGASSRSPAIYLWRKSRPLQSWKARMRVLCIASAVLSGSW